MDDLPPASFTIGDPGYVQAIRPDGFERLVTDLILAWASFDTGLLMITADFFELPMRNARILVGNMDLRGRMGKIKALAANAGFHDLRKLMAQWESQYEKAVVPRNAVCHMHYFGVISGPERRFLFGPSKAQKGPPDITSTLALHEEYFDYSINWAREQADQTRKLLQALQERPLSQRERDRSPTPPKRSRRKQQSPPKPSPVISTGS